MIMLRTKHAGHGIAVRLMSVLLVLLMVAALIAVGVTTMTVDAASASLNGSESISIYLQDSSWQGSGDIRVRFLNASGTELGTRTATPSGNKVTVTGVSGATQLKVEKLNPTKHTYLTAMQSVVNAAGSTQTVVFYDNTSTNWSDIKYYAWTKNSTTTYEDAGWNNRKAMTKVRGTANIYSATINRNSNLSGPYANIIFTGTLSGSTKQTADLALNASTANSVKVYSSSENKWITYTDVDRSVTVSVADRKGDNLNDLYVTSKTTAKWSKYNSSTPKTRVYFKPNSSSWTTAYVHFDDSDDEPYYETVQMSQYSSDPLIYYADVYFGAMVSFSTGADFDTSDKKDQGSVFEDADEPVYVARDRSWTTLDNALASDDRYYDYSIKNNNFASVTPEGGGTVVGFNATYYDYLSDNEHEFGWRQGLDDSANFPDSYRYQFSDMNKDVITESLDNNGDWRYPLVFGDDTNADKFIDSFYSQISGSRSPSITQANFRAANNSSFLGGESYRNRSIMGLVKNKLVGGDLMVTDTLKAPYFDNDWLKQTTSHSDGEKLVVYILDDTDHKDYNDIFCNFWGGGADTSKVYDTHPGMVGRNVTIDGVTGTLYRYIVDSRFTNVQFRRDGTDFGNPFWQITDNSLANFHQVIRASNGWALNSSVYKSGKQTMSRSGKRAMIIDSKFPFVETTDGSGVKHYTFDSGMSGSNSRKDNIAFEFDNNEPTGVRYYNGNGVVGKLDNNNGFFPFNDTDNNYPRNYGFGMRVDMDFTLPTNGKFENGESAKFEYSGDDDVWVFVDGNLILDIGGAHKPTTGSIDFGAGVGTITATSDTVYRMMNQTEKDTQVIEFVFNKPSSEPSGYLAKWDGGGQYPSSGSQISWSALNGKAVYTSGNVAYLSDEFKSYDDVSGKRHIFVVNDGNKSDVAIYSTDNSLGGWGDCTPSNSSYKSKVAISYKTYTETVSLHDADKNGDAVTKTFSFNNTDPTKKHHMTVFYMERGTNDSNLKIEFSIQPVLNELDVYKEVQFEELNTGIDSVVENLAKNSSFGFSFEQNGSGYGGSSGKKFNYVHADDTTTTDYIYNGAFNLKHYEEAMFNNDTDLTYGSVIDLSETKPSLFSYDTEVEVNDILNGETIAYGDEDVTFDFKNALDKPEERTLMFAEFINTLQTDSITLKKNLYKHGTNQPSEHMISFEFKIELDIDRNDSYEKYDLEYTFAGDTAIYIAEDGVVQMRPDQEIEFFGIPVGTPYRITESSRAGYAQRTSQSSDTTGFVGTQTGAIFVNEESPSSQTMSLTKTLDGQAYTGSEFEFTAKLIEWDYNDETVYTENTHPELLSSIYPTDTQTTVTNGVITFAPFTRVPSSDNVRTYKFRITETDKSQTQPRYTYDSNTIYAIIRVDEGSMDAPVFYSDENCTQVLQNPTFANTTRKGSITVTKKDSFGDNLAGTGFAVLKVSSAQIKDPLDAMSSEEINALVTAHGKTDTTNDSGIALFGDLDLYQSGGQYVYNTASQKIEWSTAVDPAAKQTYCVFEYSPTEGYLPNYQKYFVVLADKPNYSMEFSYVDGLIVMPNASGTGTKIFSFVGLAILLTGALFGAVYAVRSRRKPAYSCRHLK